MLIEQVVFHQSDTSGTSATLTLVQPQAYGGQKVGGGQSAEQWDVWSRSGSNGRAGFATPSQRE